MHHFGDKYCLIDPPQKKKLSEENIKVIFMYLSGNSTNITFDVTLGLCVKIFKNPESISRIMSMHHFRVQNCPFALKDFFHKKTIDISIIYLLVPFIMQNLKKNSYRSS